MLAIHAVHVRWSGVASLSDWRGKFAPEAQDAEKKASNPVRAFAQLCQLRFRLMTISHKNLPASVPCIAHTPTHAKKTTGQRESYISTANVGGHTRCPRSRPGHPIRRSRGTMRHLRSLGAPHCGPLRRSMFGLLSPRRRVPVLTSTAPMVRRIGPIDVLGPRALMGGLSALDSRNSWWRRMSARRAFASAPSRSGCTITP